MSECGEPGHVCVDCQFEVFKTECCYWLEKWGLWDWEVEFEEEDLEDAFGCFRANIGGRLARISMSTHDKEARLKSQGHRGLCRTAFHEVFHLILSGFEYQAGRVVDHDDVEELSHVIIRRMENLVFLPDYERRF